MENTDNYFARWRELIDLELHEEELAYRRTIEEHRHAYGLSLREPACRYPVVVSGRSHNAMGQSTIELRFDVGDDETELDFEPGRPVVLFYLTADAAKELPAQCYVERVGTGSMTITAPNAQAAQSIADTAQRQLLGVQLGIDNTTYRVMREALHEAATRTDQHFARLRAVLLGQQAPTRRGLPQVSLPWLNLSQQAAIQQATEAQEVAIVHGPPGTGKTTTLVEAIATTLQREPQVLVCAPSNTAVDWISEQLMRRGIHVLRIGNPLRISDEMLDCSYERRYSAHPLYNQLWGLRRQLTDRTLDAKRRHKLQSRCTEMEIRINADLFEQASVVSCTLIGSAYQMLGRRHFGTLFIDEAAQALEPACWAAILRADRVVMGGDHCQLPPTVHSMVADRQGLSVSMMQRVAQRWPQSVSLLDTQYRMNEQIMAFPSRWFYGGHLHAAPQAASRVVSPLDTPLTWVDTSLVSAPELRNNHGSISNAAEARLVIRLLRDYIDMLTPQRIEDERVDFGIITPYRGQARLIRRLLKMQHYFRRLRRMISVGTVDGFQGQERDVIVISLVRDNDTGTIGFLRDLRRMNVAITRARMKLIVVGNAQVLGRHRFYAELIEHFQCNGQFLQPQPPSTTGA